ncbi:MAG: Trk family potassium uptake protein [Erysipelothrix sp.]|nr:Trk family potassium uptake protein [Erysipelothrix sp.]
MITASFVVTILSGTFLLMLPIASKSGQWTSFINALYTATSATCVTGQTVVNTAEYWNYFGKTVIMIMIELGGLGFMSFVVIFVTFMGKKLRLKQRLIIQESLNIEHLSDVSSLIKYLIKFSVIVQSIGAIFLSARFIPSFGIIKGIYFSIFHSVSAFCNAGFDLFGDSLITFQSDPYVLFVIMALFVTGGLGFVVWKDLLSFKRNRKLLLHTKITLVAVSILIVGGSLILFISELKHGTFVDISLFDRIMNALFMATTPRTAGFASVDYANISPLGMFVTMILMFIGGSSGSIAGGVKVTTVAVIIFYVFKTVRNKPVVLKRKSISDEKIVKSILIIVSAILLISTATMILLMTETIPDGVGIEYVLFEVFSNFGTVGLSLGITPYLTTLGKLVSIIVMFAGRVGLMTFLLSLSHREPISTSVHYPDAHIMIG